MIFVNPYEDDLCLIGTTDIAYKGRPEDVAIEQGEIDYLLGVVNRYFDNALTSEDIVHRFSGVRPLYDDAAENPSAVTRDYVFDVEPQRRAGRAALLSVFGGKITTYRKLAEHALDQARAVLPGARPGLDRHDAAARAATCRMPTSTAGSLISGGAAPGCRRTSPTTTAGSTAPALAPCSTAAGSPADLGRHFGARLYEREARYLIEREWALTADDVLERRTKHGLHLSPGERATFAAWMADQAAPVRAARSA